MLEIKAPGPWDEFLSTSIFLAGSIEMGVAENWQSKIKQDLSNIENVILLNPRREAWDSSWLQSIDNPQFKEQVNWELNGIENADLVVFYFDPNTKSPITLMELGYALGLVSDDREIIVCCPDGFWRKGNVEVICNRNSIKVYNTYDKFVEAIKVILK